jgi:hypothetical protein
MEPSKSIKVNKEWLEKAKEQAYKMRKEDYTVAISFGDGKDYYIVEDDLLLDLYKSREALRGVIDTMGGLEAKHNMKLIQNIRDRILEELN